MHYETVNITFTDGSVKNFPKGITSLEIALHMSEGLARQVLAALINDEVWDATRSIHEDATLQLLTWKDEAGQRVFWHSSAHLLAEALEALYPGIQLGIGPAIERGFYYDVDFGAQDFDATHLERIET
jgi:threonyl-tRNA synthetase